MAVIFGDVNVDGTAGGEIVVDPLANVDYNGVPLRDVLGVLLSFQVTSAPECGTWTVTEDFHILYDSTGCCGDVEFAVELEVTDA